MLHELGRHDDDSEDADVGRYLSGGREWCSEFVSYVYYMAGIPFDGGSVTSSLEKYGAFPWMQRSTTRIIDWFKSAYIIRSDPDWYSYKPKLGDYVFVSRASEYTRKHSGIVEYVSEDGTLHTIEGNNARRPVSRFEYPNYKINETDNGSANGIVMGIGKR